MTFDDIKNGLQYEITSPTAKSVFAQARQQYLGLSAFDKAEELVKIFLEQDQEINDVKAELFKIVLELYQNTDERLWSTLLLLSFFPRLVRSFHRNKSRTNMDDDELMMTVFECFLEIASKTSVEKEICIISVLLNSEKELRSRLIQEYEREKHEISVSDVVLEMNHISEVTPEDTMLFRQLHLDDEKLSRLNGKADLKMLRLLFDIIVNHDTIQDYIEREYGLLDDTENRKNYMKVYMSLQRTLKKIGYTCPLSVKTYSAVKNDAFEEEKTKKCTGNVNFEDKKRL